MNVKLMKKATILFLIFLSFTTSTVIAVVEIGVIQFPYEITATKAEMSPSPITIDLGTIEPGSDLIVSTEDSGSDLIVHIATNIIVALSDHTDFSTFFCSIELKQDGTMIHSATVLETDTSDIITSVAAGTYDVWVGYSYTAGSTPGSGTVTVTLEY